jgi:hypothetical protein
MKRQVGEEHVSMLLRNLPPRVPPANLATSLRVIASRERQRMVEGRSLSQLCAAWLERTRLTLKDMLRPLALPATGGLFSAVVLFSIWVVPAYPLRAKIAVDIPTNLTTSVEVQRSVAAGLPDSVLVDVEVDNQGRFVDYRVVSGESVLADPTTRRRVENLLWFTKFAPATTFGTPMSGKARVLLLPSPGIYVKG